MSDIRFRLAKPSDAKQIANCHWHVRDRYTEGIFLSLGENFLRAYYKVIMDDPNEIIVCAENSEGEIVGFSSGSLNAESQAETIKKHRIILHYLICYYATSTANSYEKYFVRHLLLMFLFLVPQSNIFSSDS